MKTRIGLRERKRRALLDTIHKEAVALFAKHGYDAVTVEQIAEMAKVSRSTFFRHFPTKEAAVLYNSLDPDLINTFRAQSPDITTIQALRKTLSQIFLNSATNSQENKLHEQRMTLIRTVPKLRMAMLDEASTNMNLLAGLIAERSKRSKDDLAVRTLASTLMGIAIGVLSDQDNSIHENYLSRFDQALEQLEAGFLL